MENPGENTACTHLEDLGYSILERNFSVPGVGEIDIVARDPKTGDLVFVEVRERNNANFGTPEDSLDMRKLAKLRRTGEIYLQRFTGEHVFWRFDFVGIVNGEVSHLKYVC